MAAGAVAAMLAVLVPVLATSVVAARRRRGVRRRGRRCRGSEPFPAAAIRLGFQEVHKAHRQLDVGALVAVDRVGPPALEQAVKQVAHAAAALAGEEIAREDELGFPFIYTIHSHILTSMNIRR